MHRIPRSRNPLVPSSYRLVSELNRTSSRNQVLVSKNRILEKSNKTLSYHQSERTYFTMSAILHNSTVKTEVLESRNPRTGDLIKSWDEMGEKEIDSMLQDLHTTFSNSSISWSSINAIDYRLKVIDEIGKILKQNVEKYAELISQEMGKNVHEAKGEVLKCGMLCDYFVKNGKQFMQPIEMPPINDMVRNYYCYQPLGVILAIMPWNFPFWQVFRAAIGSFVAGNTMVLKHAPNCIGVGYEIESIIRQAVKNAGGKDDVVVFRLCPIQAGKAERVLRDDRIQGVCLTGSEGAGRAVAALAGSLLKKCVVELGGNDGYLVLKDSDLDRAVDSLSKGRLLNTGQVCIAPKRIICEESVKEEFEKKLVAVVSEKRDKKDYSVLVNKQAKQDIARKVKEAIAGGAKLLYGNPEGGQNEDGSESYYNPVILTDMELSNPNSDVEIFGPVFVITKGVQSVEEGIQVINKSSFGLGSGVFVDPTRPEKLKEGEEIASKLNAGMSFVNDFVKSDPSLPFGGIKASGFGRECGSHGVHEFCNIKTICVSSYKGASSKA